MIIGFCSALGVTVSAYALYLHYQTTGSSFCNINELWNCDVVNKSQYSEILGIPVSALGVLAYSFLFYVSVHFMRGRPIPKYTLELATGFAAFPFLFSIYLTYIELFVLYTVCLLCVTQQALILIILISLIILWRHYKRNPELVAQWHSRA